VALYAANLLLLCAVLWVHIRHLRRHKHLATAELTGSLARGIERRLGLFCVVTAAAIAVAQASPGWGMKTFILLVVIHFLPHRPERAAESGL
jgi:hypothetical protein